MKKLGLTRRIVASSGLAAALLVAAPAAVAAADDGADSSAPSSSGTADQVQTDGASGSGATESGSSAGGGTDAEAPVGDAGGDPAGGDSGGGESEGAETGAGSGGAGAGESGADSSDAEASGTESEGVAGDSPATQTPDADGSSAPSDSSADDSASDTTPSWSFPSPGRHRADSEPTGRHRADAEPTGRHRADASTTVTTTAPTVIESAGSATSIDEFVGEPGTGAATADVATEQSAPGSFYRLVDGPGHKGLIFLNQQLTAAGVLSRRSSEDGSDLLGLLGPGERLSVPAQTVAEQVLDNGSLAESTASNLDPAQAFLQQAVKVLTARLVWAGIDQGNKYLDPSDFQVLIGDNYRIVDNDGITYTYDANADTITFTNTTDEDVAIVAVDQFNVPHGDGLYVVPAGQSTTIDASGDISGYVMQGQRDSAGRAIIYGMVVVQDDQTLSYNFNPFGGAIRDTADEFTDPDDVFWDPSDGLATGILWPTFATGADPVENGVYYTTDRSGMTIHNDGDEDIAIVVFTGGAASNTLPQTDFYVIEAGGSHRIELPEGAYAVTSIQGERVVGGADAGLPRMYGTLTAIGSATGPAITETDTLPGDGIPSITRGPSTPAGKVDEGVAIVA